MDLAYIYLALQDEEINSTECMATYWLNSISPEWAPAIADYIDTNNPIFEPSGMQQEFSNSAPTQPDLDPDQNVFAYPTYYF